ncbi:MAG: thymidine phosphorylase [bacterium]|nr:thymidine phosphorylase [bacterium]
MPLLIPELIRKKRDGESLESDEIREFLTGVTTGEVPDYQISAMLMAVYLRGLDDAELTAWADAMLHSGDVLDLSRIDRAKVDKHSTGGVGDKISLPLAPAVAACGLAVPMVSGRGLGHTGGTLDKLESIPGFRVDLDVETFARIVDRVGACIIGQTERIAPADGVLYALRDVTATVESIPLIASSIMSKKLAEGTDGLVLDCKVGTGAFMKTRERAADLARALLAIGRAAGKSVTAVLTAMDDPIGDRVGNALEVEESIAVLHGEGPADTRELTVRLGAEMLLCVDACETPEEGAERLAAVLDDGSALEIFRRMVEAQGGDPRVVDDPRGILPQAAGRTAVPAAASGYVAAIAADEIGTAALLLGAGRRRKEDRLDPAVGIEIARRSGDAVRAGEPIAYLIHNGHGAEEASARVRAAYDIRDRPPAVSSRILEIMR